MGLARLLLEEAAAVGGCQERVVDLAVVEDAGGDQVVEVAGRLPQLAVAVADGSGGDAGELLGQGRPRIAVSPGGAGGRKLNRVSWPHLRSVFQPCSQRCRGLGQRDFEIAARGPEVGVAGGVAAGWGDYLAAPASPVHMGQPGRAGVAEAGGG
jgi:hypothetical protein